MASVYFLYRSRKKVAPLTVRLQIIDRDDNKIQFQAKTELEVSKDYWERTRHKKRNVDANDKKQIADINNKLSKLEEFIISQSKSNPPSTKEKDWLKRVIHNYYNPPSIKNDPGDLILNWIQYIIDTAKTRANAYGQLGISESRINGYKNLFNLVEKFQGRRLLKIKDFDIALSKEFLDWMINTSKYSEGYSRKKLDDLKTVCSEAEIHGIEVNPQIRKIKGGKSKNRNILYLNEADLEKIRKLDLDNEALENARKWLLLGCSIGQRGGDLLRISEKNFVIRNGLPVIELTQQKTRKNITIPVLKEAKKIFESGLPRKIAIQNLNDLFKALCKKAGLTNLIEGSLVAMIDQEGNILKRDIKGKYPEGAIRRRVSGKFKKYELVSSHICRRSFASNYYGKIKTPWLIQITGHGTEKMFYNYIGKSPLDYANDITEFYNNQDI